MIYFEYTQVADRSSPAQARVLMEPYAIIWYSSFLICGSLDSALHFDEKRLN
jgi:hypothetical protein